MGENSRGVIVMDCRECLKVFETISRAFNEPIDTVELLGRVAEIVTRQFGLKGCHIRLVSRDKRVLERIASYGLSERYLAKGPVDTDRSVTEALEGKMVLIEDCASDPRMQYPEATLEEGIVSMLTVPLSTRGQVVGVMRLSSSGPMRLADQELEILEVVATFCTSAIIHSMFTGILDNVTEAIRASLDLDSILDSAVRVITEGLRAKGSTIQLLDAREKLVFRSSYGLGEEYLREATEHPGDAVGQALEGEIVPILHAGADARVPSRGLVAREGIGSMLFVPLLVQKRAIGVLGLYTHHPYQFSDDELFFMKSIGDQCALAIRNAQMYATIKDRYENLTEEFQLWFDPRNPQGPDVGSP
jgi:GAF domain-containing protein